MASRALRTSDSGAPSARSATLREGPRTSRAKSLPPRDPRIGPATWRALDRYAEALASFEAALTDRSGLGLIDARYADMAAAAEQVVATLVADRGSDRGGWMAADLDAGLEACASSQRSPGERPEDDIAFAEHVLRAARSLR